MVGSWAGWCCPASVVSVVVVGGAEGGAFMLGGLAMLCDLGIGAALMGGDRGCEVPVPAGAVGWWVQSVSLSKSTQPKPTFAKAATPAAVFPVSPGSSGTASSYFMQKRDVLLWY